MKKPLLTLSAATLLILGSCSQSTKTTEADTAIPPVEVTDTTEQTVTDTVETPEPVKNIAFEIKKLKKKKGENELEIEYPVSGNPAVVDSVRVWISQQLGDSYKGDLNNVNAFFKHYSALLGSEEFDEFGGYAIDKFELEFTNDYIVTYEHTVYEYEGGAHGEGGEYGTTFLQSNGKIFSKKCITSYSSLHDLFIEGLKQYFKVKTDKELLAQLNKETSLAKLSAPGMEPWVDENGVVFSYTPYEIAPYSAGSPKFTIPYSKIEPYLTEEGKLFFGK